MELMKFSNGLLDSNSYMISDRGECAIIDCGVEPGAILKAIEKNGLKTKYIILTHGHVDHSYYAKALKEATGAPVCLHRQDLPLYSDPRKNCCALFGFGTDVRFPVPDRLLEHGELLPVSDISLEIIHTPGHTPGSVSILCDKLLFSGDTLFLMSAGRTDFYGGNSRKIMESVKNLLKSLDGDTKVYPGHGPATTIEYERENNPYAG